MVQFGLRAEPGKAGDPSLRLKNGSAQDDAARKETKTEPLPRGSLS
jgi:hypothetical protein